MSQTTNKITSVLTIAGDYVDSGRVPLHIGIERSFRVAGEDVSPVAKTFKLPKSTFSTEIPLKPQGWGECSAWIVIQNSTGQNRQVYPTNQQRIQELVADVWIGSESVPELLRVRSGMLSAFEPVELDGLYLYSPNADAVVKVTYYPVG
ncbi:MAG: hypothetical protein LBQ66_09090 [Planctomycetaceae bacterium]|jgi:hypothetical protein|nr:hypothetical protein [Planctomycetaceae bacterium]